MDSFQGTVMASFAFQDLGARTAVLLTNANRIYSLELSEFFKHHFEALGGQVLWNGDYLDSAMDYARLVGRAKDLNPDVIFIPSEARDAGLIIRQGRSMGLKCQFVGPDSWSARLYQFAGDSAEGCYFSTHWDVNVASDKSLRFVKAYEEANGPGPRGLIPLTYDGVMLLADAIGRAGTTDGKGVRDAIAATTDFEGTTGPIRFDEHGDPIGKPAVILQLKDKQTVFVRSVSPSLPKDKR